MFIRLQSLVHGVEFVFDFLGRGFGHEAHHHDSDGSGDESGEQFIHVPHAAHRTDHVLPDEDHAAADNHAGQSTLEVAAAPEQGEEHHGAEGGAEASPGEGHDAEDGAVRVEGEDEAEDGDAEHGDAGPAHSGLVVHLDAEHALEEVFGHAGSGGEELAGSRGHDRGEDTGKHDTGDEGGDDAVGAEQVADADDDGFSGGAVV